MGDRLTDLTVRDLVERLASRDSAPGGGSAAALAGAMGVALVRIVVELPTAPADPARAGIELVEIGAAAAMRQSEFLNLAELDANPYHAVLQARRLPRGTERESQARDAQVAAAVRESGSGESDDGQGPDTATPDPQVWRQPRGGDVCRGPRARRARHRPGARWLSCASSWATAGSAPDRP